MKYLWIVALVACGGTRAATTPVTNEGHAEPDEPVGRLSGPPFQLAAPRPDVDISALIPDPTEHARWPLSNNTHPVLEPYFDIAGALAQPGIGWLELCRRGVQHRHLSRDQELAEYLHAWCSVADHDVKDALYRLGQLHDSTVHGLADAVKHDCADILVDHGDSHDVEGLLSRSHLLEHEVVDLLAASYFEVGRYDDAFAMNELATGMDRMPSDETRCHRLVRGIVVGHERQQIPRIAELHEIVSPMDPAKKKRLVDETCRSLDDEVQCWHAPARGCAPYVKDPAELELLHMYFAWPKDVASFDFWYAVLRHAPHATSLDDTYRLAIPAMEVAIRTSRCLSSAIEELRVSAHELAARAPSTFAPTLHDLEARLTAMSKMSDRDCTDAIGAMASP